MQRRFYVFFLFFALFHWLHAMPAAAQRLPDTVVPDHYTLWFAPDLDKATFRGRETIRVQVKAPDTNDRAARRRDRFRRRDD